MTDFQYAIDEKFQGMMKGKKADVLFLTKQILELQKRYPNIKLLNHCCDIFENYPGAPILTYDVRLSKIYRSSDIFNFVVNLANKKDKIRSIDLKIKPYVKNDEKLFIRFINCIRLINLMIFVFKNRIPAQIQALNLSARLQDADPKILNILAIHNLEIPLIYTYQLTSIVTKLEEIDDNQIDYLFEIFGMYLL